MTRWAIVDTGPLVAYFDRRERYHTWAVEQIRALEPPALVSEPVITEALFLLNHRPAAADELLALLDRGVLQAGLQLMDHVAEVRALLRKYADVPMSLADACIVRSAELHRGHHVLTLDSDFTIYRMFGRDPIPVIAPYSP